MLLTYDLRSLASMFCIIVTQVPVHADIQDMRATMYCTNRINPADTVTRDISQCNLDFALFCPTPRLQSQPATTVCSCQGQHDQPASTVTKQRLCEVYKPIQIYLSTRQKQVFLPGLKQHQMSRCYQGEENFSQSSCLLNTAGIYYNTQMFYMVLFTISVFVGRSQIVAILRWLFIATVKINARSRLRN